MYKSVFQRLIHVFFLTTASSWAVFGQSTARHYALILEDPPVSERFAAREQGQSEQASNYRRQIETSQQLLRSELQAKNVMVVGSVTTLLNAVFVVAPSERLEELRSLPGVKGVVAEHRYRPNLNRATQLVNAPAAWSAVGGIQNAGLGLKIAIIDNGIDQTHPAFQDAALPLPTGFPICKTAYPGGGPEVDLSNCNEFTNNKVIVARSYVPILAAGSDPSNPAADSRPDDYLPRDRSGHGTAVASAAAGQVNTGPAAITFNGMAPKAYLGSYKVFGSPQVNAFATDDVIALALEDALNDRMDIASLSLGAAASTGPLDAGAACGNAAGIPCDLLPPVVESAVRAGMVVVIAAGNDGDGSSSYKAPARNTIQTPGDSPSAITVGSTTNAHFLQGGVEVSGSNVPPGLERIAGALGDGVFPGGAVAASLIDVTRLGDNGLACNPLPAGSLNAAFALIERGTCDFLVKVTNAQNAGAAGVIFYMADQSTLVQPGNLGSTSIPAIMISNSDGSALQAFADANPHSIVLIDPVAFEQSKPSGAVNALSFYSSLGPTTGDNAIKPDLVATGGSDQYVTDIYFATQSYDVLGELYSADRYTAGSGTSFATPLVAGAAALVKQAHPGFTPAQIKSALVNTASQDVTGDELGNMVSVQSLGSGKLDAGAAVATTLTANPSSISFGVVASLPITKLLQITNSGTSTAILSLMVTPPLAATGASVALDATSISVAPQSTADVHITLSGSVPPAGSYPGVVILQGSDSTLRVPYLFFVGSGTVDNMIAISPPSDGVLGSDAGPIAVKLIDSNGVPVPGATVNFTASSGASFQNILSTTDKYGVASAEGFLGSQPGNYTFTASSGTASTGTISMDFPAVAFPQPTLTTGGVVDAASFAPGKPVAPGSYISLFGANLSASTGSATTAILPLAIDYVIVSFDVPSAGLSFPGHLLYISPNQVNVQVPWELEGQSSVQVKVTVSDPGGSAYGNIVTVPLSNFAPAFFEIGGEVAALDAAFNVIGPANPAMRGHTIELYANGLGPVDGQPSSGDPAPLAPLTNCQSQATVTIGGQDAAVGFCGLAPTFAGLYQINVMVPSGLTPGTYPVTVSIGGATSMASNIVVQ